MGFLDHSTNNIIVDAVLTDTGRATLAKNDGSFVISKFAFGDDEVDYSMIQKFGVTVGKEKITKNTPIFEAQTMGDLALKYRLLSVSTPDLTSLPTLTMTSTYTTFVRGTTTSTSATIGQVTNSSGGTIATDLIDSAFVIEYDNRFLTIQRTASGGTSTKSVSNNIATITVAANATASGTSNGGGVDVTISVASFSDDYYNTYSTGTDTVIKTQIGISGRASGATFVQEFLIEKS